MKIIALLAGLLLLGNVNAQSKKGHPLTNETFMVKLRVDQKQQLKVLSFESSQYRSKRARVTNPGDLPVSKLKVGTIIEGKFQFETFSGDGGLGTTRIATGEGKGDMKISKLLVDGRVNQDFNITGAGDMTFRLD